MDKCNGGELIPSLSGERGHDVSASKRLEDVADISDEQFMDYVADLILQLRKLSLKTGDALLADKLGDAYEVAIRKKPQAKR